MNGDDMLRALEAKRAEIDTALRQLHAAAQAILRSLVVTDVHICHGHPCARCLRLLEARAALERREP